MCNWNFQCVTFSVCKCPVGGRKEDGVRFFSWISCEGTRGNGCILKYRKFHLELRIFIFLWRWSTVAQIAQSEGGVTVYGDTQTLLDMNLDNLLQLILQWAEGLNHRYLSASTILWFSDSGQRNQLFLSFFQQLPCVSRLFSCFQWETSPKKNPCSSNNKSQLLKFRLPFISFGLISIDNS